MSAKVFNDSVNIYQDQAKIIFDYYKSAAEKIVNEEMRLEQNRDDLNKQIVNHNSEKSSITKGIIIIAIIGFVLAVVLLISTRSILSGVICIAISACIVLFQLFKSSKIDKEIAEKQVLLNENEQKYINIRRDYSVDKIGVAYVPIATRVPFEGKNFLIDHTNTVNETKFNLNVLHKPEEFYDSIKNLESSLENIPLVESNEIPEEVNTSDYSSSMQNVVLHDYIGNIDRQVRNVNYLLNDSENVSVEMPIITPNSETAKVLDDYCTENVEDKPIISVFKENFESKLEKFTSLNSKKDQINFDDNTNSTDEMKRLMNQLAISVQTLSKEKNSSISKLINYTSSIFSNVLKSGYNQYSPFLEAEEIERIKNTEFNYQDSINDYKPFNLKNSSIVKFDLFSNNWVAEDGSRSSIPFEIQQVDQEVLQPIIATLMDENRTERLKIYANIEDQKRDYLEKWSSEVGNYYRDNRKTSDELITHMRETYAEYMSAYNMYKSLQDTTTSMSTNRDLSNVEVKEQNSEAEMLAGFEMQTKSCLDQQQKFSEFIDRIQDDISDITKNFSHIEYYEGSLRDSISHDTAVAMENYRDLDERRKQLVGISPFLATYAELLPEPKTNEEMMEDASINLQDVANKRIIDIENRQSEQNSNDIIEPDDNIHFDTNVSENVPQNIQDSSNNSDSLEIVDTNVSDDSTSENIDESNSYNNVVSEDVDSDINIDDVENLEVDEVLDEAEDLEEDEDLDDVEDLEEDEDLNDDSSQEDR